MKRAYRILPVYTADVSGVCSALFELGGMVVMHDPSGCNSTYNTHDELRWYDRDSLIFLSGLTELDAILGNDEKLVQDIVSTARTLHPRFIALASAPIPYLNGTDLDGIAGEVEELTGIPTFFVRTNGMHDYTIGAGNALAEIASRFVRDPAEKRPRSLNLLGATPLDFGTQETVEAMKQRLTERGWKVVSCWAMGDTLEDISRGGAASVNLVASAVGLPAAKVLQERFGTPYVVGVPIDPFTETLCAALEEAQNTGRSVLPFDNGTADREKPLTLIGEPVTMGSLGAALSLKYGCSYRVLCPLEGCGELLRLSDLALHGEDALASAVNSGSAVIADPLYRPICPTDRPFYPLPHVGFSGRCFQKELVNLFATIGIMEEPS